MHTARSRCALIPFLLMAASAGSIADAPNRFAARDGDRAKLQVSDPETAAALIRAGGREVADYGSFQIVEANQAAWEAFRDAPGVEDVSEQKNILLNVGPINTDDAQAGISRAAARDFSGKRLHLVQFDGPVKPEWYQELEKSGVRIVTYIPYNAYLVYGDAGNLSNVRSLAAARSHVRWEGAYLDDDKIQPSARTSGRKGRVRALDTDLFAIQMVDDPEANAATLALVDRLRLAPVRSLAPNSRLGYLNVIVALPADRLAEVAARPDVVSINAYFPPRRRDERQNQIVAGNLTGGGSLPAAPGYLAWLYSKGFTQDQFAASGFVVDIADDGWDGGVAATPLSREFRRHGDPAQASRVKYSRMGSTLASSGSWGQDGHGHINISIVGGYNDSAGSPFVDGSGYHRGLGVCPFVLLGNTKVFNDSGGWDVTDPEEAAFIATNYGDGVRISSDSWGLPGDGVYEISAQNYDTFTRDTQTNSAGNQQMLFVFAAGNDGSGASTIGAPGTAKNVLSVGAAENVNPFGAADGCGTPDSGADNANDIIDFSSRGPCVDGRIKPDIVAPGTHIQGAASFYSGYTGSGVCDKYQPAGQTNYAASSGTSHSTPAVAGGAALVYQYCINQSWGQPSPAMVKAYLMNSTRYMTGVDANDTLPSNNQGLGGMNLGTAFDGVARIRRDQVTNDIFTASGQIRVYTGSVSDNTKPFRVTLGWTDAPGSTSGNAFNNNLDLTVIAGGKSYKGNVFSGAHSVPGGSADPRNNVESVFLPAGVNGTFAVILTATSINSDGVPNFGGATDQDYALVIYNAVEGDAAVVIPSGSALTSESCGVVNGTVDPGETVSVSLGLQNFGSVDTTNLVATLLVTNGVTSPSGPQNYGALLSAGAAVSNTFNFTADGNCGDTVTATLHLQDGAADFGTVEYSFRMGAELSSTMTNTKLGAMYIPDLGAASPYPSPLAVAGISGVVTRVTATLMGLSHTYPADLDIWLVGPGGAASLLMSEAGGGANINNVTLTFDDNAGSLPSEPITSGTYQPAGPMLSEFIGTDPNGEWELYIEDFEAGDSGSVMTGWSLVLTVAKPICCGSDQPPVLAPIGSRSVIISNLLSFTVTGTDLSDGTPGNVTLSASNLPSWATFNAATHFGTATNTFSGTPTNFGVFPVTFYASDDDGADAETISISVTPPPLPVTNLTGWTVIQSNSLTRFTFPTGAFIRAGSYVVLSRLATRTEFEAFQGADFDEDVVFIPSTNETPTINGNETYTLINSAGAVRDGTTPPGLNPNNSSIQRRSAQSNATLAASWIVASSTAATPGGGGGGNGTGGVIINEYSDATGSGNFIYEFVELFFDRPTGRPAVRSPPVLNLIGNKSVILSNTLEFAVTATATDGDPVSLAATNLPAGASFSSTGESGLFAWTNAQPIGVYTSMFFAADIDGTNSEQVVITVNSVPAGGPIPNVWINELHYDNAGSDSGEGVEVAGPAGTDLSSFKLLAVNGSDGLVYRTNVLSGTIDSEQCNYGAVWFPIIGLQNGSPDGIALVYNNSNVVQFLSYIGGSFLGGQPPLTGQSAASIGVAESGSTPVGHSLQLTGTGTNYGQFTWSGPTNNTIGSLNVGQTVNACADTPSLVITTLNQTVANAVTALPVGGIANTNVIGELRWTNSLNGNSGTAPAATNWLINSVSLGVGVNPITVRGTNSAGAVASAGVNITRQSSGGGGGTNLILFQGFEPGDNWTITNGSSRISTDPGAQDTPANQRIRTGTHSWQVVGLTSNLDLMHASIAGYTSRLVNVRLSSTSGNNANGADTNDFLRVFVALDGAVFVTNAPDITVAGFTNATWGYWATNVLLTTAGTPVQGRSTNITTATVSSNNIASVFIILPDSATSIALRVRAINNATSEVWSVDDISVTGVPVSQPNPDSDGDGLDDAWETEFFGNLTTATNDSDYDLDGFIDLHEFLAGSNPTDSNSFLKATAAGEEGGGGFVIRWSSESNRFYIISRSTNLLEEFLGVISNLPATPPLNAYTNAGETNAPVFYRIDLQ
jgi:hypothetical protein